MKRVLFVVPTLGVGGAEQILVRWVNHYWENPEAQPPIELSLVFSMSKGGHYLEDLLPGITTYELRQNPFTRNPLDVLRAAWSLARIYRRVRPDLVVSLITHANILALLAARLFSPKTKVVICEHTHLSVNIHDFYPRLHRLLRRLISWLYPSACRIVAITEGVKDDLAESFGLRREDIEVIHNPTDLILLREKAKEPAPELRSGPEPVVLGIGRFVNQKGFVYLLRAMALVRREMAARLVLVGDGPLRPLLEEEAQRLGMGDAVQFLGFQKNAVKYLSKASVFVFPSIYEALGLVLLEALSVGIPVVATRCRGPLEIFQDEVNGLLVPVRDEKALSAAILRLLRDPGLRDRLSRAGLVRVEEEFSVGEHIRRYGRLFSEAIAHPS